MRVPDDVDFAASAARGDDDDLDLDGPRRADHLADPPDDPDGDTGDRDDVAAAPPARVREGLPHSYRMRHERHYVEALVARTVPPPVAATGAARLGGPLTATAASLVEAFEAIQAALRDVPTKGRPLRDRVAIDLARAEATRGRWLAEAAVVLQGEPMPALDDVDLVRVLRSVVEAFGPESRLSGGAAALSLPGSACPVFGDERLLTTAVGAALAAMRAVIDGRGDARKLAVTLAPRRDATTRTLEIRQWAVRVPVLAHERFFDGDWPDHPAGPSGALLLAAARRIAVAHGGALEIRPVNGGGCSLLLSLPAAS